MWCVYIGGRGCSFGYRSYSVVPKEGRGKGVGLGPRQPPCPGRNPHACRVEPPSWGLVGSSSLILTLSPTPAPLANRRRSKQLGAIGRSMEDSLLTQAPPHPHAGRRRSSPAPATSGHICPWSWAATACTRWGSRNSHHIRSLRPHPHTRVGRALGHIHSSRPKTTDI